MTPVSLFIDQVSDLAGLRIDKAKKGTYIHPYKSLSIYVLYQYTGITYRELSILFNCGTCNVGHLIRRNRDYISTGEMEICRLYNDLCDLYIRCCRHYLKQSKTITVAGS